MKKIVFILLTIFMLTGCTEEEDQYRRAIRLCEEKGGVPIYSWNRADMKDCKFK